MWVGRGCIKRHYPVIYPPDKGQNKHKKQWGAVYQCINTDEKIIGIYEVFFFPPDGCS